jgi:hypothetical protein
MWEWIRQHAGWIAAFSALVFVGTLIAIPILLARIPADYFLHRRRESVLARLHPALRMVVLVLKNGIGGVLLLAGIVMLVTPGQGLLSMLIGITLLDLPGKRRFELAIVRRPHVLRAINWIRRKAHRPPLQLPPKAS